MATPQLYLPRDIYARLFASAIDDAGQQAVLYGVRDECLGSGFVVRVKGVMPFASHGQFLETVLASLIARPDTAILGIAVTPSVHSTKYISPQECAAAYLHSLQSALLRVITSNRLPFLADDTAATERIVQECATWFRDLVVLMSIRQTSTFELHDPLVKQQPENQFKAHLRFFTCPTLSAQDVHVMMRSVDRNREVSDRLLSQQPEKWVETKTDEPTSSTVDIAVAVKSEMQVDSGSLEPISAAHSESADPVAALAHADTSISHEPISVTSVSSATRGSRKRRRKELSPEIYDSSRMILASLDKLTVDNGQRSSYLQLCLGAKSLLHCTDEDERELQQSIDIILGETPEVHRQRIHRKQEALEGQVRKLGVKIDKYSDSYKECAAMAHMLRLLEAPVDELLNRIDAMVAGHPVPAIPPYLLGRDTALIVDRPDEAWLGNPGGIHPLAPVFTEPPLQEGDRPLWQTGGTLPAPATPTPAPYLPPTTTATSATMADAALFQDHPGSTATAHPPAMAGNPSTDVPIAEHSDARIPHDSDSMIVDTKSPQDPLTLDAAGDTVMQEASVSTPTPLAHSAAAAAAAATACPEPSLLAAPTPEVVPPVPAPPQ